MLFAMRFLFVSSVGVSKNFVNSTVESVSTVINCIYFECTIYASCPRYVGAFLFFFVKSSLAKPLLNTLDVK